MFAKLDPNGHLHIAPRKVETEEEIIYNPPEEVLRALGYKLVVFTEEPEAPEGYFAVSDCEETETEIVQVWRLEPEASPEQEEQ